jgi:hypothetical protein
LVFQKQGKKLPLTSDLFTIKPDDGLRIEIWALAALGEKARGISVNYEMTLRDWDNKIVPAATTKGTFIAGQKGVLPDVVVSLMFERGDLDGLYKMTISLKARPQEQIPFWSQNRRVLLEKPL